MPKLIEQEQNGNPERFNYGFYCPGCKCHHGFKTTGGSPRWTFNGDMDKPTVRASILVRGYEYPPGNSKDWEIKDGKVVGGKDTRCHLFITDGKIQYLNDCTHDLAGKTIDMQDES